jgi:hypothetical protein
MCACRSNHLDVVAVESDATSKQIELSALTQSLPLPDSQWLTFGGQIPTQLDSLSKTDCAIRPFITRAALLTGRKNHSTATGVIPELGDAYPGYSGQIPPDSADLAHPQSRQSSGSKRTQQGVCR